MDGIRGRPSKQRDRIGNGSPPPSPLKYGVEQHLAYQGRLLLDSVVHRMAPARTVLLRNRTRRSATLLCVPCSPASSVG